MIQNSNASSDAWALEGMADGIARGLTNKAIARELTISPATVKAHVERIISKLGVADRTQAAVLAVKARERSSAA